MKQGSIYYAHSIRIYNTDREHEELKFLNSLYGKKEIIDPNNDVGELGAMDPYLKIVRSCKIVIASEYRGCIGRGVFSEVREGLNNNLAVFVLRVIDGEFRLLPVAHVRVNNPNDWKIEYGKIVLLTELTTVS